MDWKEAVALAKNGDNAGYEYLYMQTYKKNYYLVLRYMDNEEEVLDVLQEAYIKAFNKLEQLKDADKFEGWMARIVTNMAIDELRKKKRAHNEKLFSEMDTDDSEGMLFEEVLEDKKIDNRPELAFDKKETSRLVQEIIDTLSDEQRICVIMYYINGMTVNNIAQTIGVSDNTIKSRLSYARKNIENKVYELEKKGTKLYGVAPIPFFLYLLFNDSKNVKAAPADINYIVKRLDSGSIADETDAGMKENISDTVTGENVSAKAGIGTVGKAAGKAAVFSLKKAVIGVVAGLAVVGGAAYAISALNNTDNTANQAEASIGNNINDDATDSSSEQETDTDDIGKKSYKEYVESLLNEKAIPEGSGYAILDTGFRYPTLIIAPGIFNEKIDSSRWKESSFKSEQEYIDAMSKVSTVKIISDNQCVCRGNHDLQLYTTNMYGMVGKLNFTYPMDSNGNYILIYYYMDNGAFNLTYLPDKKLMVGNLNGSGSGRSVATYYVDPDFNKLRQRDVYVGDEVDKVDDKYIVYFRSVEDAYNNKNSVMDIEPYMR